MTTETSLASATPSPRLRELHLPDAIKQVLEEFPVARDEVGHDSPLERLEAQDHEEHRQDGRLQVAADVSQPPEVSVAEPQGESRQRESRAEEDEDLEGLVH